MLFNPRFKREYLKRSEVRRVKLPEDLEASVNRFHSGGTDSPVTAKGLWLATVKAVRRLLVRAAAIHLGGTLAAVSATFVGMALLKRGHSTASALALSFAFFVLNLGAAVANLRSNRLRGWVSMTVESELSGRVARKTISVDARALASLPQGGLKTLIASDAKGVGIFFDNVVRNLLPSLIAIAVSVPLLWRFSGWAGLVGLAVMALNLPVSVWLSGIMGRYKKQMLGEQDSLTTLVGEWVRNLRLIRYLSWQGRFQADVAQSLRTMAKTSAKDHFMACLVFGLSTTWWMLAVVAMVGALHKGGAAASLEQLFGSVWLLTLIHSYFMHLPNTFRYFNSAKPSIERIARFLALPDSKLGFKAANSGAALGRPRALHFVGVGFSYDKRSSLEGLSLSLNLQAKTALIGEVGAGKSTFLRLLTGELPPTQGRIEVEFDDGLRLDLWQEDVHARFRETLALVPQQPFISNDSFSNNIALADVEAGTSPSPSQDEKAVMEAAYQAELGADIETFAGGFRQEIGEGGVTLSGGQQQRLNLARAFAAGINSGHSYLVLDDTLSAVDGRTETKLVDALVARPAGLLLVTHRLGELSRMDDILVLSKGKLVERGAPDALAVRADSLFNEVLRAYSQTETQPDA